MPSRACGCENVSELDAEVRPAKDAIEFSLRARLVVWCPAHRRSQSGLGHTRRCCGLTPSWRRCGPAPRPATVHMMALWLAQELRALAGWLRFDCADDADDADAKKLNPSGLRMAASAEAGHL